MQVIVTGEKPSKEFIDFIKRVAKKRKRKQHTYDLTKISKLLSNSKG